MMTGGIGRRHPDKRLPTHSRHPYVVVLVSLRETFPHNLMMLLTNTLKSLRLLLGMPLDLKQA